MPVEYYPPSLRVLVSRGGKGLKNTEVALYCRECNGEVNEHFGNFLALYTLGQAVYQAEEHDFRHHLTIVDVGNCGFGLW
jgi:hypothetical protein